MTGQHSLRRDDAPMIRRELVRRIDTLVPHFFPNAVRDGNEWRLGSIHGEAGSSLGINRKTGMFKDFTYGKGEGGGDIIDLVAHGLGSGDIGEAFQWARRYCNLDTIDPAERQRMQERADKADAEARRAEAVRKAQRAKAAQHHWLEGQPIRNTPAEHYLTGRGIDFKHLGRYPGALRFHPAMRCPETERPRPALLAAVHDRSGHFLTCHRLFLIQMPDGRWLHAGKVLAPAGMRKGKKVYSEYGGGWIACWRGHGARPVKSHDPAEDIAVCEGIEDALSIAMVRPDMRVLAAISLYNFAGLELPPCRQLWLCADNDTKPEPMEQFRRAKASLQAKGHDVVEMRPPGEFKDFNDWLVALQRDAAQAKAGAA